MLAGDDCSFVSDTFIQQSSFLADGNATDGQSSQLFQYTTNCLDLMDIHGNVVSSFGKGLWRCCVCSLRVSLTVVCLFVYVSDTRERE